MIVYVYYSYRKILLVIFVAFYAAGASARSVKINGSVFCLKPSTSLGVIVPMSSFAAKMHSVKNTRHEIVE
jgi:hypothetical protein